jgi:ribosomal protein S12 methylthiotransferase
LGIFTYSHEEGTYAAKQYEDNIAAKIKKQRADIIMSRQQPISLEINQRRIGQEYKTIIDRIENDYYIGRTEFDSPEVDNEVIVKSDKPLRPGEYYQVKIIEAKEFDLSGIVIK